MSINTTQISTNRYAPDASAAINLYSNDLANDLTLGQIISATCIRTAAALEHRSVTQMNKLTADSDTLNEATSWLERIAAGRANWSRAKTFLINTMGISASELPANLSTYDNRMTAVVALKAKIDVLVQQQQQDMINLQTTVNRRDVAYSTSSNTIRALGTSTNSNAANF